jgi:hypothetical protein
MPRNKDLKRLVRTRMQKTGEAYTTARAHITKKRKPKKPTKQPTAAVKSEANRDYAELAGMSDATIKDKTGCSWDLWVLTLDYAGAGDMSHGEIAAFVNEKYKIDGWWSQAVTVGYERIKGLRARGQRMDGSYEASKSRTFNVPVQTLYDAWNDASTRKRWLNEPGVQVRTATAPKSMRLGWKDGTIIAIGFTAKGNNKSSVALAHTKLPDRASSDRLKQYWAERLDALGKILR